MVEPRGSWCLDDVARGLAELRQHHGSPSYAGLAALIERNRAARGVPTGERHVGRSTVHDAFQVGRRRLDSALVGDIVQAMTGDLAEAERWSSIARVAQGQTDMARVVTARLGTAPVSPIFVGRAEQLDVIMEAVAAGRRTVVIEGLPGSGKSQLAAVAATALAQLRQADVLRIDLRGYDADNPPADPQAALAAGLRALGVPAHQIGADASAQWHQQLATGRHVVVLDDVREDAQLAPLLSPDAETVFLVTSRRRLESGADQAVEVIDLGDLSGADAVALLRRIGGEALAATRSDALEALLELTGRLPLAVSLTGGRIATRPDWTLEDHLGAARVRLDRQRLDEELAGAVAASYDALPSKARSALRLLALPAAPSLDRSVVPALLDQTSQAADQALDELARHHLIEERGAGLVALHHLVRAYVSGRSLEEDRPSDRACALGRLLTQVAAHADRARDALIGTSERPGRADAESEWMHRNLENLLALGTMEPAGEPDALLALAEAAGEWLDLTGHYQEARSLTEHALAVVGSAADEGQTVLRVGFRLGRVLMRLSEFDAARERLERTMARLEAIGDDRLVCMCLNGLASIAAHQGDAEAAGTQFARCVELAERIGDDRSLAAALDNSAIIANRQGRLEDALALHGRAQEVAARNGDSTLVARSLVNSAALRLSMGDPASALDLAQRGLDLAEGLSVTAIAAYAFDNLGSAHAALGHHEEALTAHLRAVEAGRSINDSCVAAAALASAGEDRLALGLLGEADTDLREARQLAVDVDDEYARALADQGLGKLALARSDVAAARAHFADALVGLASTEEPAAVELRAYLADIGLQDVEAGE